jgi:hypothetical protein
VRAPQLEEAGEDQGAFVVVEVHARGDVVRVGVRCGCGRRSFGLRPQLIASGSDFESLRLPQALKFTFPVPQPTPWTHTF